MSMTENQWKAEKKAVINSVNTFFEPSQSRVRNKLKIEVALHYCAYMVMSHEGLWHLVRILLSAAKSTLIYKFNVIKRKLYV